MKTITKPAPENYEAFCNNCGCEFTYEREDIEKGEIVFGVHVTCPTCGEKIQHYCKGAEPVSPFACGVPSFACASSDKS